MHPVTSKVRCIGQCVTLTLVWRSISWLVLSGARYVSIANILKFNVHMSKEVEIEI